MGKYFVGKMCVYLDQFAVSALVEGKFTNSDRERIWGRIYELLRLGIEREKLVVPYSVEHLIETSAKGYAAAQTHDVFLFALSKGLTLQTSPSATCRLTINLARKRVIGVSTFFQKTQMPRLLQPGGVEYYNALNTTFRSMIDDITQVLNPLRAATAQAPKASVALQRYLVASAVAYYQDEIVNYLNKFSRYGFWEAKPVRIGKKTIPLWAEVILSNLWREHNITRREAKRAKELIIARGLQRTLPTLFVRAGIESTMATKHQKESPNDYVDIERLSVALPACDLILTDKAKVYDVKTLGLDKFFSVEVYSGSNDDLLAFANRLAQLVE
jgi:hypothetical protein